MAAEETRLFSSFSTVGQLQMVQSVVGFSGLCGSRDFFWLDLHRYWSRPHPSNTAFDWLVLVPLSTCLLHVLIIHVFCYFLCFFSNILLYPWEPEPQPFCYVEECFMFRVNKLQDRAFRVSFYIFLPFKSGDQNRILNKYCVCVYSNK